MKINASQFDFLKKKNISFTGFGIQLNPRFDGGGRGVWIFAIAKKRSVISM